MNKAHFFTIITITILFFTGCANKPQPKITTKNLDDLNLTKPKLVETKPNIPKVGTDAYILYKFANEVGREFNTPILSPYDKRKHLTSDIVVVKSYTNIEIIFNNKNIFDDGISTLLLHIKNQLAKLSTIIKNYPKLIIQVIGYTDDKIDQISSDERAINIAEVFFNSGVRNEIYAKGCSKRYNSSKKVAIYIYPHIKYMQDNCRN